MCISPDESKRTKQKNVRLKFFKSWKILMGQFRPKFFVECVMDIDNLVLVRDTNPQGFNPSDILYRRRDAESCYRFPLSLEDEVRRFLEERSSAHGAYQAERFLAFGHLENLPAEMQEFHMIFPGTIWKDISTSIHYVSALVWNGKEWQAKLLDMPRWVEES